jgi:hypothetical protein
MSANGECCANDDHGGDGCVPLSEIEDGYVVHAGIEADDHSSDCLVYVIHQLNEDHPGMDWPDVPGDHECDCERDSYSTWACGACGSRLHGERHGMTLFKAEG